MATRINCHSAFRHYEMFHSGGCGSGNYGSIFNTTYNISCGGHGGGFWGGLGYGIGNALGGFFGNWFGGGMNMGFGGFGMGGFGFPSFGFPSFGGWGNFWGGGMYTPASTSTSTSTTTGVNDKDNTLIENFNKEIEDLADNASDELRKGLYNRIKAKRDKPEDSVYETQNKLAYQELLDKLKAKYPKTEFESGTDGHTQSGATGDGAGGAGTAGSASHGSSAGGTGEAGQGDPAGSVTTGAQKIEAADSFAKLPDYDKLSDEDKKKYKDKCIKLAKDNATTPEELRIALKDLPTDVRENVKASFYKTDYKNVKAEDMTADSLKKLIEVIDDSPIADFENITVGTPTKSGNLWTIPMTSHSGSTKVNYIQVSVDPVDGEIIFHGRQSNQHYVLQQDNDGKLHLMQYKYHEGYGSADVKQ